MHHDLSLGLFATLVASSFIFIGGIVLAMRKSDFYRISVETKHLPIAERQQAGCRLFSAIMLEHKYATPRMFIYAGGLGAVLSFTALAFLV